MNAETKEAAALELLAKVAERVGDSVRVRRKSGVWGLSSSEVGIVQQSPDFAEAVQAFAVELHRAQRKA